MPHSVFVSNRRQPIDNGRPHRVVSPVAVSGLTGRVQLVEVVVDVAHTSDSDLTLTLITPSGDAVLLANRVGGRGDGYRNTRFSPRSATGIREGRAPFTGSFRPEGSLSALQGQDADELNGDWKLLVDDRVRRDGGELRGWQLEITTRGRGFHIDVVFEGGLTSSQRNVFEVAAERWSEVIVGDLPEGEVGDELIDDVRISAEGRRIDGPGSILGQAGPTYLRAAAERYLPLAGRMAFDSDDLAAMEANGSLLAVIVHEMGHVLGIGTLWHLAGHLQGAGSSDPRFTGSSAVAEWLKMTSLHSQVPGGASGGVPVANTGGRGTRDAHWRESVFRSELMTGFINAGMNPLSRVTIASLEDLGYEVDYAAADEFAMLMAALSARGAMPLHRQCRVSRFEPVIAGG